MINWKQFKSIQIFDEILFQKNASLKVINTDGSISDISVADLDKLNDVTATAAELNIMDGATYTVTEANNALDRSAALVTHITGATLTAAAHANGKVNLLSLLAGFDLTLPAATGTGDVYEFVVGIVNTSNDYGILADGSDTISGCARILDSDTNDNVVGFLADGTDDKIEINGTTKGGLTIGDRIVFTDILSTVWQVQADLTGSGTVVTPFAAT